MAPWESDAVLHTSSDAVEAGSVDSVALELSLIPALFVASMLETSSTCGTLRMA